MPNSNSVTVNANGNSGGANLTATIYYACGSFTVSKYISSASGPSSYPINIIRKSTSNYGVQAYEIAYNGVVPYSSPMEWETGTPLTYFEFEGINGFIRSLTPFTPFNQGFGFTYDLSYNAPTMVRIRYKNQCGFSDWVTFNVYSSGYGGYYRVSPNPISSTFSISVDEKNMEANVVSRSTNNTDKTLTTIPTFDRVVISDITGNIKLRQNVSKTNRLQVDVSRLSNGIYYLQLLSNGKLIEKKTIQIRK